MSRYSTDSDDDDYRSRRSRRKRSVSSSSEDSHKSRYSSRRSRKTRSRSRDRNSKYSYKDGRESGKSRNYFRRSKSPSYRPKRNKSISRSRSRSRTPPSTYGKTRVHSKSKRRYRSRSRSKSYSRRSRSKSRKRSRSRQRHRSRSRSGSYRRSKHPSNDKSSSDSAEDQKPTKDSKRADDYSNFNQMKHENNDTTNIVIPSNDPIIKQEQLDEIDAPSFIPKSFISSKSDKKTSFTQNLLIGDLPIMGNNGTTLYRDELVTETEKKKNDTVFHDNIVFEDTEAKIQRWVKKLYQIRRKSLFDIS